MWDFLRREWGDIASVVGLFFSFLAFIFSKRASIAAEQAKEAALSRALGEDLNNACKIAGDIAAYLRSKKTEIALVRLVELISLSSYIISRWNNKLPETSKNQLLKTREELHIIHDLLGKINIEQISSRDRNTIARFCREVPVAYEELYGVAVREIDKQD